MDEDIVVTRQDLAEFDAKMRAIRPRSIAFTSKKAASLWLRRRTRSIRYGQQKRRPADFCEVFVLPSPSAAGRRWWSIDPWHDLADWIRSTAPWRF
jgi:double-stranded uracil-DNA glycosylase